MLPQYVAIHRWLTGLMAFLVLILLSIAGGLINDSMGLENGHETFFDGLLMKLLFTLLVISFGYFPLKFPNTLRVPVFRFLVWGALVIAGKLWPLTMDGDFYKYLHRANGYICSLYSTFLHLVSNQTLSFWWYTGLYELLIFSVFLWGVIVIGSYLSKLFLKEYTFSE